MTGLRRLAAALTVLCAVSLGLALGPPTAGAAAARPPGPTVSSVSPSTGSLSGGTTVTVVGTGLTNVKKVLFGGAAGTAVHSADARSLTVTTPAHPAGVVDVVVVTAAGQSATSAGDRFTFTQAPVVVTAPPPPNVDPADVVDIDMHDVDCAAPGDCQAVGRLVTSPDYLDHLVFEHLTQGTWVPVQPPLPGDATDDERSSVGRVSCATTSFCVAVGRYRDRYPDGARPLIETWDGSAWSPTSPPVPGGASTDGFDYLTSVSCPSADSCAVVGAYATTQGSQQAMYGTWDGASWSLTRAPLPRGGTSGALADVDCVPGGTCTAVGAYGAAHGSTRPLVTTIDARSVSSVAPATPADDPRRDTVLSSVSCPSAATCVASGTYTVGKGRHATQLGLAEVLDGSGSHPVVVPAPTSTSPRFAAPHDLSCWSDMNCLVVGNWTQDPENGDDTGGSILTEITGAAHATHDVSTDAGTRAAAFDAVACAARGSCLVGGEAPDSTSDGYLATVEDGMASTVALPLPAGSAVVVSGVALDSNDTGVAVGQYLDADDPRLTDGLLVTGLAIP